MVWVVFGLRLRWKKRYRLEVRPMHFYLGRHVRRPAIRRHLGDLRRRSLLAWRRGRCWRWRRGDDGPGQRDDGPRALRLAQQAQRSPGSAARRRGCRWPAPPTGRTPRVRHGLDHHAQVAPVVGLGAAQAAAVGSQRHGRPGWEVGPAQIDQAAGLRFVVVQEDLGARLEADGRRWPAPEEQPAITQLAVDVGAPAGRPRRTPDRSVCLRAGIAAGRPGYQTRVGGNVVAPAVDHAAAWYAQAWVCPAEIDVTPLVSP